MSKTAIPEYIKRSPFVDVERDGQEFYVYNNVIGITVGSYDTLSEAVGQADLLHKHYQALERQFN